MAIRRSLLVSAALLAAVCALPRAARAGDDCRGVKSAHCFCKVTGGPHMTAGSPDGLLTPPGWDGKELFTYRIPNKCFNQQADWVKYHLDDGCWKACRDAYGVDGARPDPAFITLKSEAGKRLRAAGFCGGWVSAPTFFAAGTNKFRSNTAAGLGIGIGGSVVTVNGQKVCR